MITLVALLVGVAVGAVASRTYGLLDRQPREDAELVAHRVFLAALGRADHDGSWR
jgi:hypothetical protein